MEKVRFSADEVKRIVSVVACGPSALRCGAARAPGYVIAVNDAYAHIRHDAVLSMDGRWTTNRVPEMTDGDGPIYLRRSAFNKLGKLHVPTETLQRVRVFDCDWESAVFGHSVSHLNGANSGYCALNLAYVMRPDIVYLFGFDHKGEHFHRESDWVQRGEGCANSPRKFSAWADMCYTAREQFDAAGIAVINTNADSAVRAFKFGDAP